MSSSSIWTFFYILYSIAKVSGLGSMSSIAVSYGENGPAFCAVSSDGSHSVSCFGADASIVYGSPQRLPFLGLTAGDSFVCGLLLDSHQPYCWGSNLYVKIGVPQPIEESAAYSALSAGDHHLCALRKSSSHGQSTVDCWGYNMTNVVKFTAGVAGITAGSGFNCALFARNRTATCWGDEIGSSVISTIPHSLGFQSISAGGFHVCGILTNSHVFCWGRSMGGGQQSSALSAPMDSMIIVVCGRFHSCGIRASDRDVRCWGFSLEHSVPPPSKTGMFAIAAGDFFTCGVLAERSLRPLCWGAGGPWAPPIAVSPGICEANQCSPGTFEFGADNQLCRQENSHICIPCSSGCPVGTEEVASCNLTSDRQCGGLGSGSPPVTPTPATRFLPVFVAEVVFAVLLVSAVSIVAFIYVRYRLRHCRCSDNAARGKSCKDVSVRIRPEMEELRIRRARMFTYRELETATGGFREESQVGKGSFSTVFKGVLLDGTVVAVKRAVCSSSVKKSSKEFHTELDLLSRLNHAHLLNLLGYCEEGGERLLVYEFMAHGSLYQHLHGKEPMLKKRLDWVRRVTIAVQAARGIEYLHGYACPPVIHRDIKSSNILIDEEQNARVADFGLSLLGPTDSSAPLSELPAGTLGYLDPEYYRLHYLTTKSDVYSFGVLLLEILSGRKAIDMQFEEGNIVEWAVPLIRAEEIMKILDPALKPPADIEALNKIASIACKCVRMRGKDRPSMDKVTTALERALAMLMGSPCNEQPILPTEVVLGSSRLHKKASQRSSNQSCSENEMAEAVEDQRIEYRAPSWITFPSVTSSQRVSDGGDLEVKALEGRNLANGGAGDSLRCLEEEIGPASSQEDLYLQHNF